MKTFVLFDFDGVIADTFELCLAAARHLQPGEYKNLDDYRRLFYGNIYEEYAKKYHNQVVVGLDHPSQIKYYEYYLPRIINIPPVSGIEHVLQDLSSDHGLIIISSTLSVPLGKWLQKYNLAHYFLELMGADVHHSKQEKARMLFKKYKTSSEQCVFITDTLGDVREANQVGLRSIAVTWGFHRADELEQGSPITIVNTPDELLQTVHGLFDRTK